MPKYAILSDIHANVDAFEKVLAKCAELSVDKFISLGDIVGYNADPARCVAMMRELKPVARVRGNHDEYAIRSDIEMSGFNTNAKIAIKWTHDQLSKEDLSYLDSATYCEILPECDSTAVHSTLDTPETWGYVFDSHHATASFTYQKTLLCFCGHSHVPVAFVKKQLTSPGERPIEMLNSWSGDIEDDLTVPDVITVEYRRNNKYLFNVGSIGQPRNGDPRASFAIWDSDAMTVSRYRLPYDIKETQRKIFEAGLPERLALRLEVGS